MAAEAGFEWFVEKLLIPVIAVGFMAAILLYVLFKVIYA